MRWTAISGGKVFAAVLLTSCWLAAGRSADARPPYFKAFIDHYTNVTAAAQTKCGICHAGDDKKVRNNYGMAMEAALPGKNCKDEAAIKAALVKIEGEMSAVAGKTFGDLLKAGQLPASK